MLSTKGSFTAAQWKQQLSAFVNSTFAESGADIYDAGTPPDYVSPFPGDANVSDAQLKTFAEAVHQKWKTLYRAFNTSGFCAKDCAVPRGDVMLEFGEGVVDFPAVFAALVEGGFSGPVMPVMVECCRTGSLDETTASARRNREFLEALRT